MLQMRLTPGIGSSSPLTWPYGVGLDAGGHYFRNWLGWGGEGRPKGPGVTYQVSERIPLLSPWTPVNERARKTEIRRVGW